MAQVAKAEGIRSCVFAGVAGGAGRCVFGLLPGCR